MKMILLPDKSKPITEQYRIRYHEKNYKLTLRTNEVLDRVDTLSSHISNLNHNTKRELKVCRRLIIFFGVVTIINTAISIIALLT